MDRCLLGVTCEEFMWAINNLLLFENNKRSFISEMPDQSTRPVSSKIKTINFWQNIISKYVKTVDSEHKQAKSVGESTIEEANRMRKPALSWHCIAVDTVHGG